MQTPITSQAVVDALVAWQRANRLAVEASKYAHIGNQAALDEIWHAEEAALNAYTEIYNAYWTQGATQNEQALLS